MSRRPFHLLAATIVLLSAICPAAERSKHWVEVNSPHFRVVSDGSESQARQAAKHFELIRAVFETSWPAYRLHSAAPLTVLALRDERSMKHLVPSLWDKKGPKGNVAGMFVSGWETSFAIIRLDLGSFGEEVAHHEYVHYLQDLNHGYLPVWLSEGMADFYGSADFSGAKVKVGIPTARLGVLRSLAPIPLRELLAAGRGSKYLRDPFEMQRYYAQAWGLTHFLVFGSGMKQGEKLNQFYKLLRTAKEDVAAFEQVFGNIESVEEEFHRYIRKFSFYYFVGPDAAQVKERSYLARKLSPEDAAAVLTAFDVRQGRTKGLREEIEAALRTAPGMATLHRNLGFLAFHEGRDAEAEASFQRALQFDPNDGLSLYYNAMLRASRGGLEPEGLEAALQRVRQLSPDFAPAHIELSRLYVGRGRMADAAAAAAQAAALEPRRAGYLVHYARLLKLSGQTAAAAELAAFVVRRWFGSDRDQGRELLQTFPGSDKLLTEFASDRPQGTQAEGTISSIHCNPDKPQEYQLTLRTKSETLTLSGLPKAGWGLDDTLWYGGDHFNLCYHLQGRRAEVVYQELTDQPPELLHLRIADDLPQSSARPRQPPSKISDRIDRIALSR